jgi:ribonuclease Z
VLEVLATMLTKSTSVTFESGKAQYTLRGRSRAGEATCFSVPELRWFFDCGALIEGWKPEVVFLSHGHSDHAHYLTHIRNEKHPPTVILPVQLEPFVQAHLTAYQEMTDCMTQEESQNGGNYPQDYVLRPLAAGEEIRIQQRSNTFVIRTLQMEHRVPCLGFSIFNIQQRIKKEYEALSGREIGRIKKEGVQVSDSCERPFLCYLGDTTAAVFELHPEILELHKVIVVECSFIDEASIERARTTTHMHWNDLRSYVKAHPHIMFLLTHFSLKYTSLELREFFNEQQILYPNIHPMLLDEEIEEIWWRKKKRSCAEEDDDNAPPKCSCRLCNRKE